LRVQYVVCLDSILPAAAKLDPKFLIGHGKLENWLFDQCNSSADVIYRRSESVGPLTSFNNAATDLKIIDKKPIDIGYFAQRAQSREGKIQSSWRN